MSAAEKMQDERCSVAGTDRPCHWAADAARGARRQGANHLPPNPMHSWAQIVPGLDLWDMWPIARADGSTFRAHGRTFWFFLATPRLADPEDRHDCAHIRLTSVGAGGWSDHGRIFPDGFTPGSREWSGSAVLGDDGVSLTLYFTAAGRAGGPRTFEQRLFESRCTFTLVEDGVVLGPWTKPRESVRADGCWYAVADQAEAPPSGIMGFRDPSYFRDPVDGCEYLLFVGSAGWVDDPLNGVVGVARRDNGQWVLRRPLIEALGVNNELERPHIVVQAGRYYLFWSTHARRFAKDIGAPTGLYAMVADRMSGPWFPVNGSGLVAANPLESPLQAYCWWVTGEGDVMSFVDYPGIHGVQPPADPATRRAAFGGTAAPMFALRFDGDFITLQIPDEAQSPASALAPDKERHDSPGNSGRTIG